MYQHLQFRILEEEEREKGPKEILAEIIAKNFPNMVRKYSTGRAVSPRQNKLNDRQTTKYNSPTDEN